MKTRVEEQFESQLSKNHQLEREVEMLRSLVGSFSAKQTATGIHVSAAVQTDAASLMQAPPSSVQVAPWVASSVQGQGG